MKTSWVLTRERSEEEKLRRHLYGDKGAKFSKGKVPRLNQLTIMGAITTMFTKDIMLFERHED